jgi:hypothetical protein
MEKPPLVLAGLYVVAYAEADDDVVFEQRHILNVNGQWLGRTPCLAICREFDTREYAVQYCNIHWEPLGIAAGHASVDVAKVAAERSYHGINGKWIETAMSLEQARALHEAELRALACSFCGKKPTEVATMVGDSVRICGQCVDDFYDTVYEHDGAS